MVSLLAGVQVAPPSTAKSNSMCATLTPLTCPEKPGTPNSLVRTVAAPVTAAISHRADQQVGADGGRGHLIHVVPVGQIALREDAGVLGEVVDALHIALDVAPTSVSLAATPKMLPTLKPPPDSTL